MRLLQIRLSRGNMCGVNNVEVAACATGLNNADKS